MRDGLRAAIKPMARLGIAAILAIAAIAAIQPLASPDVGRRPGAG